MQLGRGGSSDSSSRSASISSRYRSAATHRDSQQARRVTSGVTCGLPSRSPPIHEPKRSGAASTGRPRPVLARSARSSARAKRRHRVPQALLEDDEAAAHLVDRRGPLLAHLARRPRRSRSHGGARQRAPRVRERSDLAGRVRPVPGNAVVLLDDPAARHLGRVRGQHQLDLQRAHGLVQPVRRDARREQTREAVLARSALRRARLGSR